MSSMLGSIAKNVDGSDWETYRHEQSRAEHGRAQLLPTATPDIAVLSIAPGWVRTDMGGPSATFDVETSCRNVANAIEKHAGSPATAM